MFSKINKLESMLKGFVEAMEKTEKKRYTATQSMRADNISLAEGATLNIQMNNMIISVEVLKECLEIVGDLKVLLPIRGVRSIKDATRSYENELFTRALKQTGGNRKSLANLLGINQRQIKYLNDKRRLCNQNKEVSNEENI